MNAHVGEIDILPNSTAAEIWPVREVVADIWRRVLGPKARDSGLHILRATIGVLRLARFQKEIAGALGVTLPLTALMRLGTVDAIAAAIESGIVPDPSPLVLLRDGQEDLPLYVISAGGPILELCDLAQLIEFPGQIWGGPLSGRYSGAPSARDIPYGRLFVRRSRRGRNGATAVGRRPARRSCRIVGFDLLREILAAVGVDPLRVSPRPSTHRGSPRTVAWHGLAASGRTVRRVGQARPPPIRSPGRARNFESIEILHRRT